MLKNRLLKCVACVLLLSMIVSATPAALAMEDGNCEHNFDGNSRGDHVCHSSNMSTIEDGYIDNGDDHLVACHDEGPCDICNKRVVIYYTVTEDHFIVSTYTGNNYHSGNRHYCQYRNFCIYCGHTTYHWESYICPGNGNCIMPNGYTTSDAE